MLPPVVTPKHPSVRISTANTNRDGSTGTYGTLFTAGSSGAFFEGFRWQAEGNVTNGAIRLFIQDGGSGNIELIYEAVVPTTTFSAGVTAAASGDWYPRKGILLSANSVVKVSTNNNETFSCWLESGGNY